MGGQYPEEDNIMRHASSGQSEQVLVDIDEIISGWHRGRDWRRERQRRDWEQRQEERDAAVAERIAERKGWYQSVGK
jgi:hypothetical protein